MGYFVELGPYSLDDRSLLAKTPTGGIPSPIHNPHSWARRHNLVFVDYATVGFSTCREPVCKWDDAAVANALHAFLHGFYAAYPEFRACPLWVAGESYAGILVTVRPVRGFDW